MNCHEEMVTSSVWGLVQGEQLHSFSRQRSWGGGEREQSGKGHAILAQKGLNSHGSGCTCYFSDSQRITAIYY